MSLKFLTHGSLPIRSRLEKDFVLFKKFCDLKSTLWSSISNTLFSNEIGWYELFSKLILRLSKLIVIHAVKEDSTNKNCMEGKTYIK
jgi:hypothetical protein